MNKNSQENKLQNHLAKNADLGTINMEYKIIRLTCVKNRKSY